jgi:hypothetical protein
MHQLSVAKKVKKLVPRFMTNTAADENKQDVGDEIQVRKD